MGAASDGAATGSTRRCLGLGLLSLATLLLELSLTRVMSVALWYHFGFLVISTALLGFGAAGVTVATWRWLREDAPLDATLAALGAAFAVASVATFRVQQVIPFDPFALLAESRQLLWMPLYYVAVAAPFYASGLAIALLFTRGAGEIGRLYAFDLVGAAAGCAAVAIVMPALDGAGAIAAAGGIGALSAVVFAPPSPRGRLAGALALCLSLSLGVLATRGEATMPIATTPGKRPPRALPPPLYTAWNTFSKVQVFELPSKRGNLVKRVMFIDGGTAATGIRDLRGGVRAALARTPDDHAYPTGVAYLGKPAPRVLVLGSGAGAEVLDALHFGAASVTAVEINPIINDVGERLMRDFWGDLFADPAVHLVTDEARSFVRRSQEQYDAIVSAHTISNAAVASGALSLSENYTLTREAFEEYLDHLGADGTLYLTRPEAQIARLASTAREALARRGVADASRHVMAWRFPSMLPGRPSFGAGFLLQRSPMTDDQVRRVRAFLQSAQVPGEDPQRAEVLYAPGDPHPGSLLDRLLSAPDPRAVYAAEPALLEPATDDRPFFNQHVRWSSLSPATFLDLFRQKGYLAGRMALEDRPVAEVTLVVVLLQSCLVAGLCILIPLWRASRRGQAPPSRFRFLTYFSALGLGFIFVEIALLQRFSLFLGQPVHTLAVVLAGLLLWTGLGAALAGRLAGDRGGVRRAVSAALVVGAAVALLAPAIFSVALGLPLPARIAISLLLLAPLGVALGMPFPTGLRLVQAEAPALVPWAWGTNCFFTVIGTIAAQILGMALGFRAVLVLAGLCYLVALLALGGSAARGDRTTRT